MALRVDGNAASNAVADGEVFCSPSSSNKQQQQGKYHGFEAS